jgi:SLT domain-containing protein
LLENVNLVAKGFSGDDPEGLSLRARELAGDFSGNGASSLGGSLKAVADAFAKLFTTITEDGDESTSTLQTFANALESVANGINAITRAYGKVVALGDKFRNSIVGQFVYAEGRFAPKEEARAAGGSVMANKPYKVGEFGPETFVPAGVSGSIRPDNGAGSGVTIIMNGVIDGESARRSIERLLQDSSRRTGAINLVGATL